MCEMCNGASADDVVESLHRRVVRNGFTLVSVDGPVSWVYSIGLARIGHPELVVAGAKLPVATELIDILGQRVMDGVRLESDTIVEVDGETYGLGAVHPSRIAAGLCAMWFRHEAAYPGSMELRVLQVHIPDEHFCACHAGTQPRLDLPGGALGPPRRERRRVTKAKRRRSRR